VDECKPLHLGEAFAVELFAGGADGMSGGEDDWQVRAMAVAAGASPVCAS